MKIKQLTPILDAMAVAHANAGSYDRAEGLRKFAKALEAFSKENVGKLSDLIRKQGQDQERP